MSIQDIGLGTGQRTRQAAELAGLTVVEFMHLPADKRAEWFAQLPTEELVPLEEALAPYEERRQRRRAEGVGTVVRTYGDLDGYHITVTRTADSVTLADYDGDGTLLRETVTGPGELAAMGIDAETFARVYEKRPDDEVGAR